jgi:hypothetical protein
MHALLLLARILHIGSGVFWAGSVIFINILLVPSIGSAGPQGLAVMQQLHARKYFQTIVGFAYLTVLSGLFLVWHDARGLGGAWFASGMGQGISVGMTAAIIALAIGVFVVKPSLDQILAIAAEAQAAAPEGRQAIIARADAIRARLKSAGVATVLLLLVAIIGMAIARYL